MKKNPASDRRRCGSPITSTRRPAQAGEARDHGKQKLQRRPDSVPHANSAGGALSGAWPLQSVAAKRGCAQPHRQSVSRQRFSEAKITPKVEDNYQGNEERSGNHAADRRRPADPGGDLTDRGQRDRPDQPVSRSQYFSRTGVFVFQDQRGSRNHSQLLFQ